MEKGKKDQIPRSLVEKNIEKTNTKEEKDGQFILVYWEDETFGVIHSDDVLLLNKEKNDEGFLTGRAKYGKNSVYDVVYLMRGSNDEKLFALAENIDTDFRRMKRTALQCQKRKRKRKELPDFECDSDSGIEAREVSKVGENKSINGEVRDKKDSGDKGEATKNKLKGTSVKKRKEVLLEEKRKQESSRAESLVHAEKYILQHVSKKAINKPLFDNMHDLDPGKSGSKEIHVSSSNPSSRVSDLDPGKSGSKEIHVSSSSPSRISSNAADLSDDTHGTTFDAGYKVSKKTLSAPSNGTYTCKPPSAVTDKMHDFTSNACNKASSKMSSSNPSDISRSPSESSLPDNMHDATVLEAGNKMSAMSANFTDRSSPFSSSIPAFTVRRPVAHLSGNTSQLASSSMHDNIPTISTSSTLPLTAEHAFRSPSAFSMASGFNSYSNNLYPRYSPPSPMYQASRTTYPIYSNTVQYPQQQESANLIGDSLSVIHDQPVCNECTLKERVIQLKEQEIEEKTVQISSLSLANDQAQMDIQNLHQRVRELEVEIAGQQGGRENRDPERTVESVVNHYLPSRGIQVELANYQFIPLGDEIPPGLNRLDEGEELCVPKSWMCLLLSKCTGKGPAFTFKKMMDGFFEPEEIKDRKAVEFASKDKIMKAIKMYTLNKLKMKESDFHSDLTSKLNSARRAVNNGRTKKGHAK